MTEQLFNALMGFTFWALLTATAVLLHMAVTR